MELANNTIINNSTITQTYVIPYKYGHINFESFTAMIISTLMWRILYEIFRFSLQNKSPEYCCRIVSFIHGIIIAFIGINQCYIFESPFNHPEWRTSYLQSFIIVFSFGYFVHDLIWLIFYDTRDKVMLCHHIFCVLSLCKILFKGYSGAQATCALGSMELTNPFLQIRWFLRTEGMHMTPVYVSTELTFFIIFFTIRLVFGSYILKIILSEPNNYWDFVFMALGIYCLSWMFIFSMIKYVLKKYRDTDNKRD